ncbi:DUF4097 family beta strand repeat-containing protein [Aquimarina sp. RZ0]|uniref:DUF4097 family beta strand repeat-containing protein n=1 Tax=Aquimarina sp. RZ0 TaxID=2607730 RepID=UPI0011F2E261|nr:DUF4097 family beta strand repeat-containing protein [Aquimarina sp. RZ0]KAA1243644.1 DUF4097 domain-containing protein [Aquimarina sp. RZ0]
MKILAQLIVVFFLTFQINAQKIIEKELSTSANQILVEFKFAEQIILKTWDKDEVYIKAEASINNGEFDEYFNLKIDNTSSILEIESDYGDLFKKRKKDWGSKQKWDPCDHTNIESFYTLYIPKTAQLRVKSISGNVTSENYIGNLEVDIISGDIDIKKYGGKLDLKTISGDIDINISQSRLSAETISGLIYSDKEMEFDRSKNSMVGSKVTGTFGNAKSNLHLKTISGSIFLRK